MANQIYPGPSAKLSSDLDVSFPLVSGKDPLVIKPANEKIDYHSLMESGNADFIKEQILQNGAVLIKGFTGLDTLEAFQETFSALCGSLLQYQFQTSPRTEIDKNVYTSTDHPSSQVIQMHTESSYSLAWPRHIGFFCLIPADEGGQTPIASEAAVINRVGEDVIEDFIEKKIMYVRNFTKGLGLSWQKAYKVTEKEKVEAILQQEGMKFCWLGDDHLRVEWVLPAFQTHPVTGHSLWFNHMYFGHRSLYDKKTLSVIPDEYLPFLTYYGDGSPIENEVISKFTAAYKELSVTAPWQKGDLILLDNMQFSHGRQPFTGARKILVGMANEVKL